MRWNQVNSESSGLKSSEKETLENFQPLEHKVKIEEELRKQIEEASEILKRLKQSSHYVKIFETYLDHQNLFMLVIDNESYTNRTDYAYLGKVSLLCTDKMAYIPSS